MRLSNWLGRFRRCSPSGCTGELADEKVDPHQQTDSQTDWPNYGRPNGTRYSSLSQINRSNVNRLQSHGPMIVARAGGTEAQPLVVDASCMVLPEPQCDRARCRTGAQMWKSSPASSVADRTADDLLE